MIPLISESIFALEILNLFLNISCVLNLSLIFIYKILGK